MARVWQAQSSVADGSSAVTYRRGMRFPEAALYFTFDRRSGPPIRACTQLIDE